MYIYVCIHTHTHTSSGTMFVRLFIHSFIHSFICPNIVTNIYQKDTNSYFEVTFLFQVFSIISYIMKQYVSESGFATIPRWKPTWWSPQKELPAVTKHCRQFSWPRYVCGEWQGIKCRAALFMGPTGLVCTREQKHSQIPQNA